MRNAQPRTWNMVIKTEKRGKSDTHTVGPEMWGETMKKVENETHTHCRTWKMVRNTKNEKNEIYKLQELKYGEKSEKRENEKCILQDLEYGEKTEKCGKLETHTVGS